MPISDLSFTKLMENLNDGIYFVDPSRVITYWNKSAEKISGFLSGEVVGKHCSDNILIHVDDSGKSLCNGKCPLHSSLEKGSIHHMDIYLKHKDGYRIPISVTSIPLADTLGDIIGAVEVFSEKTNSSDILTELKKMAFFDTLTEVGNRRHADAALKSCFAELDRYDTPFGLLFIDIDNFKHVNDTFGHETGDKILRMVAKTISKNIRGFDTVSRWGGEEFIAVLNKIKPEELRSIAEKIHMLIDRSMLLVDNRPLSVTVSIGATMAKKTDNPGFLITRADKLMYQSKLSGRDKVTSD
jgi:diguanylate cyclase (GGDEF)-like protein/PAS domain S-box-containing protein